MSELHYLVHNTECCCTRLITDQYFLQEILFFTFKQNNCEIKWALRGYLSL